MLKKILSPETCAVCRNCCIFEEQSAWELPSFSPESAARLADCPEYRILQENQIFLFHPGKETEMLCF